MLITFYDCFARDAPRMGGASLLEQWTWCCIFKWWDTLSMHTSQLQLFSNITMFNIIYNLLVTEVNSRSALLIFWAWQTFLPATIQCDPIQDLVVWGWLSLQVQVQVSHLQGNTRHQSDALNPPARCRFSHLHTSSAEQPRWWATSVIQLSATIMPWGPPKPLKAVLDVRFVRHMNPRPRMFGTLYEFSMWNKARSMI